MLQEFLRNTVKVVDLAWHHQWRLVSEHVFWGQICNLDTYLLSLTVRQVGIGGSVPYGLINPEILRNCQLQLTSSNFAFPLNHWVDQLLILGMVIPPLIGNSYNRYFNPYYWV